MGRPHRRHAPGLWSHVVNRGIARQPIFGGDRDRVEFLRLLGVAHERLGVRVHAYCLMANHYHLLLECPDDGLSEAMHLVGSVYVRHANERLGRDGPLFTDRFYAKPVTDDAYALRLVRYIHRNPLAFVAPDRLREYRWSSLRAYLGDRRVPPWLDVETVLAMSGGREALVAATLGDDPLPGASDASAWGSAVELMLDEHLGARARQGAARTVFLLLLDQLGPERSDLLGTTMTFPSDAARRTALSRARREAREHPELERVVSAVLGLVAGLLRVVPGASADRRTATMRDHQGNQRNEKERSDESAESPGTTRNTHMARRRRMRSSVGGWVENSLAMLLV